MNIPFMAFLLLTMFLVFSILSNLINCRYSFDYMQIEVDTDRDNFMNPWEAKEYGLIDAVIDDGKPGLVAPIGDSKPPPKTRVWDMWKVEGSRKAKKNLPSEHRMLQNRTQGGDERGTDQEKETPAPV